MKKIFTILLMACVAHIAAMAVVPTFMGLEIEGSCEEFQNKLKTKGFVYTPVINGEEGPFYTGTFAGKKSIVAVYGNSQGLIETVGIYLPAKKTWTSIYDEYKYTVQMYADKYGTADIVKAENNGLTPGTTAFHDALDEGKVSYRNIFVEGKIYVCVQIEVATTEDDPTGYQLLILYINDNNYEDEMYEGDI